MDEWNPVIICLRWAYIQSQLLFQSSIMGFSASSHLGFGILRFSIDIWHLFQTFSINIIAWFWSRATNEGRYDRLAHYLIYSEGKAQSTRFALFQEEKSSKTDVLVNTSLEVHVLPICMNCWLSHAVHVLSEPVFTSQSISLLKRV